MTTALHEALNDAISSGRFVDTKIVLFSRRDTHGRVCKPRALYANSHVLRSVPYFEDREFPLHSPPLHEMTPFPVLFGTFTEAETKDFSESDGDEFAEDYTYSSDSDLEEDGDFERLDSEDGHSGGPSVVNIPAMSPPPQETPGQYEEHAKAGKVIRVQDVAFIT